MNVGLWIPSGKKFGLIVDGYLFLTGIVMRLSKISRVARHVSTYIPYFLAMSLDCTISSTTVIVMCSPVSSDWRKHDAEEIKANALVYAPTQITHEKVSCVGLGFVVIYLGWQSRNRCMHSNVTGITFGPQKVAWVFQSGRMPGSGNTWQLCIHGLRFCRR